MPAEVMEAIQSAEWRDPSFSELDAAIKADAESGKDRASHTAKQRPRKRQAGNPFESAALIQAKEIARQCAEAIRREYGHFLNRAELLQLARSFKSALIPKRKPGRKPNFRITRAVEDYKAGIRGVALCQAHIPRWEKLSRWRQRILKNNLMEAIRMRLRRELPALIILSWRLQRDADFTK